MVEALSLSSAVLYKWPSAMTRRIVVWVGRAQREER